MHDHVPTILARGGESQLNTRRQICFATPVSLLAGLRPHCSQLSRAFRITGEQTRSGTALAPRGTETSPCLMRTLFSSLCGCATRLLQRRACVTLVCCTGTCSSTSSSVIPVCLNHVKMFMRLLLYVVFDICPMVVHSRCLKRPQLDISSTSSSTSQLTPQQ